MKSQHCSAQPGRQSRTTLFKAGDPSEAQPLLHMHKPWLDTGPTPGNQSLLVPRPAECTHLLHSPHPGKMARVHTPQQGSGPPLRPWSPTELQGQHHPSSPQVPRLQAWALLETPKERGRNQSIPAPSYRPPPAPWTDWGLRATPLTPAPERKIGAGGVPENLGTEGAKGTTQPWV